MKVRRKKGFFSISAVAKMFSVHQQTVRLYEKQGLVSPKRSDGNTRLFSEEDIDRLEEVIYLTHELGINLAGVEVIFKLKKQLKKMQKEMNKLFEATHQNLEEQTEESQEIVKRNVTRLTEMKKKDQNLSDVWPLPLENSSEIDDTNWDVEYEDNSCDVDQP